MHKKLLAVMLATVLLVSFGCGSSSPKGAGMDQALVRESASGTSPAAMPDNDIMGDGTNQELNLVEQKIIKNGEISLTVTDSDAAETAIVVLVTQYQGLVQDTNTYISRDTSNVDMTVRVPADNFILFMDELKTLGEVTRSYIYTTDVTEEYIDLSARQKTLTVQEERLQEMLKKAENVQELLQVENELARVRGEIERITGRLNYLNNRVAFSTINIHLSTKYIPTQAETKHFGDEILFSFQDGIGSFINLAMGLLKALVWLLPFLIIIIPLFIFIKKKWSSRGKKG